MSIAEFAPLVDAAAGAALPASIFSGACASREGAHHAAQRHPDPRHNMQNVGELAAGVAHDLNNFLQVIGASLELLARRNQTDPQAAHLTAAALGALLRATKLSRQLLTLSRGHELQLEVLCLDDLQSTMGDILLRALPESIELDMHHAPDLWPCTTDSCLLEAAILNLAINARDAMPEGGHLHIGVDNRSVGLAEARAESVRAGDFVVASVRDSGTGMDASTLARAFEPFFTTKEFGKGTGLGLSQVQAFAKRCNGYATIVSAPLAGTEVRIYLPRAE